MTLPDDTRHWRDQLASFCEQFRTRRGRGDDSSDAVDGDGLPETDSLDPLRDEQRRISGGVLIQFLNFLQGESAFDNFPALASNPVGERVFVCATDLPGVAAARDILEIDSDHVMVVTKGEWRAWLESPATDDDEAYDHHFLFWSVWHQRTDVDREIVTAVDEVPGQPWVHEEGFAVAERAGRGARHLWSWDNDEMTLIEEAISTWVSAPNATGGPDPTDEFPAEDDE